MEKKLDDLIEHTVPENYEEYIKDFDDTKNDPTYVTPRSRYLKDFDFVDQRSKTNRLGGHANKYCMRAHGSLFTDLIKEIRNNPDSSFETCYTKEDIIAGDIPEYFSVIVKEEDKDFRVGKFDTRFGLEAEVYASHILNYLGIPVAYNKRIDRAIPSFDTERYLMSVDVIRPNEKLVLLNEIIPQGDSVEIDRYSFDGLRYTLENTIEYLKRYLTEHGISYTNEDIDDYKKFLVNSIRARRLCLRDKDCRNGNGGILIDEKNKTFRPLPNIDMEMSFSAPNEIEYYVLEEFYEYDPEEYSAFTDKIASLVIPNKKGDIECVKIADRVIKNKDFASVLAYNLYLSIVEILKISETIKRKYGETEKSEHPQQILA